MTYQILYQIRIVLNSINRSEGGEELNSGESKIIKLFIKVALTVLVAFLVLAIPNRVTAIPQYHEEPEKQYLQEDEGVARELFVSWSEQQKLLLQQQRRQLRNYISTTVLVVKYQVDGFTKEQLGNCYNFVKGKILVGYGPAINHPAPLKEPKAGYIMISRESKDGHYSEVIVVFEKEFVIAEFNYIGGAYTERIIPKNSPIIKGFYKKDVTTI